VLYKDPFESEAFFLKISSQWMAGNPIADLKAFTVAGLKPSK
jgi:hypothetical protein